ncbi:hypothetical protein HZC07_04725 [Candidatus Micrarchaeota archaeon]|nr:hypothetical protein [Candidatus Micrarchaeota archaeon]
MEKDTMIKILVVVVVLGFITELFFFGQNSQGNVLTALTAGTPQESVGSTVFNGTIRTYDPVIVLPANTSSSILEGIRSRPGVKGTRTVQNQLVIDTETRDDVYPLATQLKSEGLGVTIIANIALPQTISLTTATGQINATTSKTGVLKIQTEPLVDVDSTVTLSVVGVSRDGEFQGYQSAEILIDRFNSTVNASVTKINYRVYTYKIPWESRNSINVTNTSRYSKTNTIIFSPELSPQQVIVKRGLTYITYIDTSTAEIEPTFENSTKIRADFAGLNVTFPDSNLIVVTNGTDNLPFNSTVKYSYNVLLPNSIKGYKILNQNLTILSEKPVAENSTIEIVVKGSAIGETAMKVTTG